MTTPRLQAAIAAEEGRFLRAYPDPLSPRGEALAIIEGRARKPKGWVAPDLTTLSGDPWTIGCGHTGPEVHEHLVWTDAQVDAQLTSDIARVTTGLDKHLSWWRSLCDSRQDVLVQMGFQLGVDGLLTFHRTLGCMQDHNYSAAAAGMRASLWARQTPARADRLARIMETGEYPS